MRLDVSSANNLPDVDNLSCPIGLALFSNPVMSVPCGHLLEEAEKNNLENDAKAHSHNPVIKCPCCRKEVQSWMPCPPTFKKMLEAEQHRAYVEKLVSDEDIAHISDVQNPIIFSDIEMVQIKSLLLTSFYDPMMSVPCGCVTEHTEKSSAVFNESGECPCCQKPTLHLISCPPTFKKLLHALFQSAIDSNDITYDDLPLDEGCFEKLVQEEKLKTLLGERFIEVLKNSSCHLNGNIVILSSTRAGRDLLRKNLIIKTIDDKKQLCFGNAVLSPESLKIQINGINIQDLLSREIEADLHDAGSNEQLLRQALEDRFNKIIADLQTQSTMQIEEHAARQALEAEAKKVFLVDLQTQLPRWLMQEARQKAASELLAEEQQAFRQLLVSTRKQGLFRNTVTSEYRMSCDAADNLLQLVVEGQRAKVRVLLENLKINYPALLKKVLTSVSTKPITDYSGKKIENLTLLQAAAAANDFTIYPGLAHDPAHQGMCDIIQSYFGPADQAEVAEQYKDLLKRSLRQYHKTTMDTDDIQQILITHRQVQEKNTFDFSKIIAAIWRAHYTLDQVEAALNKVGANFTEADDATRAKSDDQLTLTESLNRFREQFERYALNKIAVNPYDLIKVFQVHQDQFREVGTLNTGKLFSRQVIGFVQRYLSAADARVFARGLYATIDGKCVAPDHFTFENDRAYNFYPNSRSCDGLGFDYLALKGCAHRAEGYASMIGGGGLPLDQCQVTEHVLSNKNDRFSELMLQCCVRSRKTEHRLCSIM